MDIPHEWPEPAWLATLDPSERDTYKLRFYLKLAGLYANKDGSIMQLSEAIGLKGAALSTAKNRGQVGPETALKLEQVLGRRLFPWEIFLPDLVLDLQE